MLISHEKSISNYHIWYLDTYIGKICGSSFYPPMSDLNDCMSFLEYKRQTRNNYKISLFYINVSYEILFSDIL